MILKLSKVLLAMEVKGPYMHANRRLTLIQKWCDTRDFQLTKTTLFWWLATKKLFSLSIALVALLLLWWLILKTESLILTILFLFCTLIFALECVGVKAEGRSSGDFLPTMVGKFHSSKRVIDEWLEDVD